MDSLRPEPFSSTPAGTPPSAVFFARRAWRQAVAAIVAAIVAWLVFRAYGQPGFLLDFVNLRLC